jgi:hypothetical protein
MAVEIVTRNSVGDPLIADDLDEPTIEGRSVMVRDRRDNASVDQIFPSVGEVIAGCRHVADSLDQRDRPLHGCQLTRRRQ